MHAKAEYAGVFPRLLAVVLDLVVLSAAFFPMTRLVKGTWVMSSADHGWASGWFITDPLCLCFLVLMFAYFVLFEGLAGATPGKRVVGLRVVAVDGGAAGLVRSLLRNVLRVVDNLPTLGLLAVILITTSPERARFGDRVAGTRVLRNRREATSARPPAARAGADGANGA
jgi:uncharacterized RDD family membrane protein YckC